MTTLDYGPRRAPDPARLPRRVSSGDALTQTMVMAWRATKKMRRNFEQFFDVTIQPLLFTAMFAGIFGGAVAGSVDGLPAAADPRSDCADRADGVRRYRYQARGHRQGRLRPVQGAADLPGRSAGRPDGRRHDPLRHRLGADLRHRHRDGLPPRCGVPSGWPRMVLAIFTGWSMAWIFTWFGTVGSQCAEAVQGYSLMVMFPLTFLSNAFVPVETLPAWLEAFATVNPVSHVVTALRDLANDGAVTRRSGGRSSPASPCGGLRPALGAEVHPEDVTPASSSRVWGTRSWPGRSAYPPGARRADRAAPVPRAPSAAPTPSRAGCGCRPTGPRRQQPDPASCSASVPNRVKATRRRRPPGRR